MSGVDHLVQCRFKLIWPLHLESHSDCLTCLQVRPVADGQHCWDQPVYLFPYECHLGGRIAVFLIFLHYILNPPLTTTISLEKPLNLFQPQFSTSTLNLIYLKSFVWRVDEYFLQLVAPTLSFPLPCISQGSTEKQTNGLRVYLSVGGWRIDG